MSEHLAEIVDACCAAFGRLAELDEQERVDAINAVRQRLSEHSPLRDNPVDCVLWIKAEEVRGNDYNPNTVAPPEMELLRVSIDADGFTQPIVAYPESEQSNTIVDGFHRGRVGTEDETIRERCKGRLPVTLIRQNRGERNNRIAATIRHNRARGKHGVEEMSKIVLELTRRNWSLAKIAKELGMDADEVLRLKQITGLAELFRDREFSEAWDTQ